MQPRVQVVMLYCLGIIACLTGLRFSPVGVFWMQWILVFCLGFCIYGPQMLIGLCGAELVGPESVGASEGFLGWIAYLGAFPPPPCVCCRLQRRALPRLHAHGAAHSVKRAMISLGPLRALVLQHHIRRVAYVPATAACKRACQPSTSAWRAQSQCCSRPWRKL